MMVHCYDSIQRIDRDAWNGIVGSSGYGSAFHSYDWIRAYEKSVPFSLAPYHLVSSYQAGRINAILPLYLVNGCPRLQDYLQKKVSRKPNFQPPMLLSHSFDGFSGGLIGEAENELVYEPLIKGLETKAQELKVDFFGIVNIPEYRQEFIDYLKNAGYFVRNISPTSAMDIKWNTFDEYTGSLSVKNQRNLKTFRKKSLEAKLTAEVVSGVPDLDRVLALLALTLNKNGHSHDSQDKINFYRTLLENLNDHVQFLIVKNVAGDIITFLLLICQKTVITAWIAGIDYQYLESCEPYHFAYQELIRHAIAGKMKRIEIGRGNFEFKRRYGFVPYLLLFAVKTLKEPFIPELDRWSMEIAEGCVHRFNKNVIPKYAIDGRTN